MFRALTLEREYGGGGSLIARRVAEILGWKLLDGALIEAVARAAHVDTATVRKYDEQVDSWWHRFNRGGVWAAAVQAGVAITDAQFFDSETVAGVAQREIARATATGNCVIVGRGGQCVLQDRADVLHVFVYGPWRERISRVRSRITPAQNVAELIRSTDEERASYIQTYYGFNWKDPRLYHMMINSQIGIEGAAFLIVEAAVAGGQS
jgi:cytidylate kinase